MELINEESKKSLLIPDRDEIIIKVIKNPITGEKDFLVTNNNEFYGRQVFIVKKIMFDDLPLDKVV